MRIHQIVFSVLLSVVLVTFITLQTCSASANATSTAVVQLHQGWTLQSSSKVSESGATLSSKTFQPRGWYKTTVPSTVLAAQVAAGEFPDPYFGMNLRKIPGTTYPIGSLFARLPMDKKSPYARSWWYRTEFELPAGYSNKSVWLHFEGINYSANVWLNGQKVADAKDVRGAYRIYEFDVSALALPGQSNVLAVETFAPTEKDLGINWVDWNPAPPDKNMGLWGDVYLSASGAVSVRHPQVITHFLDSSLQQADLTVMVQLYNASEKPVHGVLESLVGEIRVRQEVTLQAKETRSVSFAADQFAELRMKQPKVWWPAEMGVPNLHDLKVSFSVSGNLADEGRTRFGIREVTSELTDKGHRLFRINGKKILIRGAAWAQDMLFRRSRERLEAQIQYVRDMNLNTIRLEAQLESEDFFNLADEKGILIMAGWCCCDIWEQWKKWQPATLEVARESLRTQALRLRSHPSLLMWVNGSDGPPPPHVERAYLQVLKETAWPNPVLSSAAADSTPVTGPSGVKMPGPYDYEPPSYWLVDKARYGGAYGFNTETSPGPAIPPVESLRKMLPQDHVWPIDDFWNFHSAGERFKNLNRYNQAMDHTYGRPAGLEDYLKKSQAMAYDGERAMFEAYGRNKYNSTGVIQWMLNNAWPSIYWHLYDYFLYPAGGYFGTKKACEPLHVQYSYDDRSIVVVNSRQEPSPELSVTARVYDFGLKEISSQRMSVNVEADTSKRVLTIPPFPDDPAAAVYFVRLHLHDQAGKEVSSNFYWLPAKLSRLDWDKTPDTAFTPIATFEDLTALNHLPPVRLEANGKIETGLSGDSARVTLHNPSQNLAFQVHVGIRNVNSEEEILPVLWEDNYLDLMPGESKELTARYLKRNALGEGATLKVEGWNIEPITVLLTSANTKGK
jgi:exo-1,4-beta-D-glucosaminidase